MSEQGSLQELTDPSSPLRRGGLLRQKLPYLCRIGAGDPRGRLYERFT